MKQIKILALGVYVVCPLIHLTLMSNMLRLPCGRFLKHDLLELENNLLTIESIGSLLSEVYDNLGLKVVHSIYVDTFDLKHVRGIS